MYMVATLYISEKFHIGIYKNVSKTSVKQSWVKNPKSAPPKETLTMDELFPGSEEFRNYR